MAQNKLQGTKYHYSSEPCACPPVVPDLDTGQSAQVDLELLKMATEHFRGDIASHFTQGTLFAAIQVAFISFFSAAVGPMDAGKVSVLNARWEAAIVALGGLIFALLWLFMARGREQYIRLWRDVVVHLDRSVDRHLTYLDLERIARADRWNPTRLAMWVPTILAAGWLAAIIALIVWA
jgi:hypothetical protein